MRFQNDFLLSLTKSLSKVYVEITTVIRWEKEYQWKCGNIWCNYANLPNHSQPYARSIFCSWENHAKFF